MGILPGPIIDESRPATAADFDKILVGGSRRRHSGSWNAQSAVFGGTYSRGTRHLHYQPDEPRPTQKKTIPDPGSQHAHDFSAEGGRLYPDKTNAESFKTAYYTHVTSGMIRPSTAAPAMPAGGSGNPWSSTAQMPAPALAGKYQKALVLDPMGRPMRFKRGEEGDAIGVGHIRRFGPAGGPFDTETVVSLMRGGIGRVTEGDRNWSAVELCPGFHQGAKPGRWYNDLDAQPGQSCVLGATSKFMREGSQGGGSGSMGGQRPATAAPATGRAAPTTAVERYSTPMGTAVRGVGGAPIVVRVGPHSDGRPMWK